MHLTFGGWFECLGRALFRFFLHGGMEGFGRSDLNRLSGELTLNLEVMVERVASVEEADLVIAKLKTFAEGKMEIDLAKYYVFFFTYPEELRSVSERLTLPANVKAVQSCCGVPSLAQFLGLVPWPKYEKAVN